MKLCMQCLLFVLTGLFVSSAAHNQVSIDGVSNADCVAAIAFQTVKPKFGDNDGVAGGSELNAVFPTHRWRFDLEHCSLTGEEIGTVSPLVGDAVATAADEAFHQTDKPKYAHDSKGFPGAFFPAQQPREVAHGFGIPTSVSGSTRFSTGVVVKSDAQMNRTTIRPVLTGGVQINQSIPTLRGGGAAGFEIPKGASLGSRHVFGYLQNGDRIAWFHNGRTGTGSATSSAGLTIEGGHIGNRTTWANGKFSGIINDVSLGVYSSSAELPSVEDFIAFGEKLMAEYDVPLRARLFVQIDGDSNSNPGDGNATNPNGAFDRFQLDDAGTWHNAAIPGARISHVAGRRPDAKKRLEFANADKSIAVVMIGTNNLQANAPTAVASELRALADGYRDDGFDYVIAVSILPRHLFESNAREYNAILRSATWLDGFVDMEAVPLVSGLFGLDVVPSESDFFINNAPDIGVHPNVMGQDLLSTAVNREVNLAIRKLLGDFDKDVDVDADDIDFYNENLR